MPGTQQESLEQYLSREARETVAVVDSSKGWGYPVGQASSVGQATACEACPGGLMRSQKEDTGPPQHKGSSEI